MSADRKTVGLEQGIEILMDPDSSYDVIIREGEGLIMSRPDDDASPIFDELRKSYQAASEPTPTVWKRIVKRLSNE